MFPEILDQKRKKLVRKFAFLSKFGFYLAGGTALALQVGHRTSVDFDFYTKKKFDTDDLLLQLKKIGKIEVFMNRENTLGLLTESGIEMTFFKYPYPLVRQPKKFEKIKVASVEDIAAMKIAAIIQRGTKRDFVDIFYLLKKYSLESILHWTQEKYPQISLSLSLKGLTYFQDAENDKKSGERIRIFDKNFDWKEAKKYIEKKVFDFQKKLKK